AMEPQMRRPSAPGSRSGLALVARLKPGVSIAEANAEMRVLDRRRIEEIAARSSDARWRQVTMDVEPAGAGLSILRDRFAASLRALMAGVSVLLAIACINLASMLLARGAVRHREMAVRVAVGAGRFRLVRQVLTESLLLAVMGTALGLLVAYLGAESLVRIIEASASDSIASRCCRSSSIHRAAAINPRNWPRSIASSSRGWRRSPASRRRR